MLSKILHLFFSLIFNRGEYINFACSNILLWSDGNISSPVKYSYLSTFPDVVSRNCSFSTLILSSIVIINFYIVSKRFFLKRKELSDERVV